MDKHERFIEIRFNLLETEVKVTHNFLEDRSAFLFMKNHGEKLLKELNEKFKKERGL